MLVYIIKQVGCLVIVAVFCYSVFLALGGMRK